MIPQITVDGKHVTIDGRAIEPLQYRAGRRECGTVFFDKVTGLYVKLGKERAESEREVWAKAQKLKLTQHLAPLVASGPTWNAFRHVYLFWQGSSDWEPSIAKLATKLGCHDAVCGSNWGILLNGEVCIIDYEP